MALLLLVVSCTLPVRGGEEVAQARPVLERGHRRRCEASPTRASGVVTLRHDSCTLDPACVSDERPVVPVARPRWSPAVVRVVVSVRTDGAG